VAAHRSPHDGWPLPASPAGAAGLVRSERREVDAGSLARVKHEQACCSLAHKLACLGQTKLDDRALRKQLAQLQRCLAGAPGVPPGGMQQL
jgi:hypothetical protein